MKKQLFGVLSSAVLLGGLLAGCGEADVKKVSNSGSENKTAEKPAAKKEAPKSDYKVGETISVDGMEVTLKSVSWGKTIEGVPTNKGKVLRLEIVAKNNTSGNATVDSSEFQAYVGDAKAELYFGNGDTNMSGGELKKGKSTSMILEFDVPAADKYEIFYEPMFSMKENSEVKWTITKTDIK